LFVGDSTGLAPPGEDPALQCLVHQSGRNAGPRSANNTIRTERLGETVEVVLDPPLALDGETPHLCTLFHQQARLAAFGITQRLGAIVEIGKIGTRSPAQPQPRKVERLYKGVLDIHELVSATELVERPQENVGVGDWLGTHRASGLRRLSVLLKRGGS